MSAQTHKDSDSDEVPAPPWDRQPSEGPKHFQAFCVYRDLPTRDRSLSRTAKTLGCSKSLVERWSSKYSWPRRAAAYDDYLDQQQRQANEKLLLQIDKLQLQLMRGMAGTVLDRVFGFDGNGDPARAVEALDPNQLMARDIPAWARELTRMISTRPEFQRRKAERLAQMMTISQGTYENTICDVIDVAFSHIPADARSTAAETLTAYLNGNLDMNRFRKPRP
jgi:hypothetical protein